MALFVTAVAIVGCRRPAAAIEASPRPVRLSSGAAGGSFHAMGDLLTRTRRAERLVEPITNQESAGSVSNLEALQDGAAECAFSYADVAYEAVAGRLPGQRRAFDRLKGVALVQVSPLYFLVPRHSPIHGVADLRGRTIALRSRESGSLQAAMLVLKAYDVDTTSIHVKSESFPGSFARLQDSSVDALFILSGQLSDPVSRAVAGNARILPLSGPPIDRIRQQYPFLRPILIPARTYPGQESHLRTIGVESLLLCRADMDVTQVYEMTKTWFRAAQASGDGPLSGTFSPGRAAATPVPLHPGAARYYRERQLRP
jgi:TRAP transporter TAXI family solute receptor